MPVTFSVVSGPGTINGNNLSAEGDPDEDVAVTVRASQGGNDNYNPTHTDKTFVVHLVSGLEPEPGGFSIHPNPATSTIIVRLPVSPAFKALVLKDVLGRDVIDMDITQQELTVDVEKFPRGIYIVRITGDDQITYTKKIILR